MIFTGGRRLLLMLAIHVAGGLSIASAQAELNGALRIEACYDLARARYPLIRQQELIERSRSFTIENAARAYWPQVVVAGQASHQSAVTALPTAAPGVELPFISKDQFRFYAEASQNIYDNNVLHYQKEVARANAETEQQRTEASLYLLRERINQIFFGILMTDARLAQTDILQSDIQSGLQKVKASIENGTALRSSADVLQAQLLRTEQSRVELRAGRRAYLRMLSVFIGHSLGDSTVLILPQPPAIWDGIRRPELRMYELQKAGLDAQKSLLSAKAGPRLGVFLQGGVGRPALNMLSNEVEPYYIGGLRLSWNIGSYYTLRRERQLLDVARESTDVQRDIFLFNMQLGLQQYSEEIRKQQALLATDEEIVMLRARVKAAAAAQLSNGVITGSDFLREANAEDQARQDIALHRLQLLLAQFNYATTTGQ